MGRGEAKARERIARSRHDLGLALAAGELDRALSALFELPGPERAPFLAAAGALVPTAADAARKSGNWARLCFFASRVEREPALLGL